MNASVRLEHTLLAAEAEHELHAMVEIAIPDAPDAAARPPLRLALVLDRSGSMAGEKLEVAKRCAAWLVSRLRPQDELALVDYDDSVRLLAPLAPVEQAPLRAAIASIWPGGSTNLSGGWLKGLEQLQGDRGKILLLTDGLANVGITDEGALVELSRRAGAERVGTSTIGFGHAFAEELLTQMADAGGGNAHYAETPDAAPAIFAAELEGLTSVVAQNVSLEIRPQEHVEVVGILNEYPHLAVSGGVQVQLGDGYGGERRRIVFSLQVPRLAELGPVHLADLVLRYVSVGDEIAHHELTIPVTANAVSAAEAAGIAPDGEVQEEVLLLKAARAREEAIRLADTSNFDAAQHTLREAGVDFDISAAAYSPAARKRLWYDQHQARRLRSR